MVWKILAAVAAVLLLLMLYGMYLESTPQGAEKIRAREAIAAGRFADYRAACKAGWEQGDIASR